MKPSMWLLSLSFFWIFIPSWTLAATTSEFSLGIRKLDCSVDITHDGLHPLRLITPENCLSTAAPLDPSKEIQSVESIELIQPAGLKPSGSPASAILTQPRSQTISTPPPLSTTAPVKPTRNKTTTSVFGSSVWNPIAKTINQTIGFTTTPDQIEYITILLFIAIAISILDIILLHSRFNKILFSLLKRITKRNGQK